jgi:hypothetical protein
VVVEGVLERFASGGGAINLLVRRLAPLDAPDLLSRRPRPAVKDFSMLDERELARIALEQPRVAVAAAGGATAAHVRPAASAASAPSAATLRAAGAMPGAAASTARGPATPGSAAPGPRAPGPTAPGPTAPGPIAPQQTAPDPADPVEPLPAGGTGAEDFRAVAPPIMSFAQGRRR